MKKNKKTTKKNNVKSKEFKRIPLRASGRPSIYKKIYAQWLLEYFDVEPYEVFTYVNDKGDIKTRLDPVRLPTLERFATLLNVDTDCLYRWATAKDVDGRLKYPEFCGAYYKVKQMQKEILVTNGLKGLYQSNFAIFVATNFTDMASKSEVDNNINTEGEVVGFTYIIPKDSNNDETKAGNNTSLTANEQTTSSQINP